jgi:cytochrome c-type biogenesis protein CcmH
MFSKNHFSTYLQRTLLLGLILFLLLFSSGKVVKAQESTPSDDEVNRIASQLFCPVCDNIPLDSCPTEACEQWRGLIRQKLSEGWTEEEIIAYFAAQYGDQVLAEPPRRGLHWLIYVLPLLVIIFGAVFLIRFFNHRPQQLDGLDPLPEVETPDDPYLAQVDRDLASMREDE